MKIYKILIFIICTILMPYVQADDYQENLENCIASHEQEATTPQNAAILWYKSSAENKALFKQIYGLAYEQIYDTVKQDKLAKNSWGVIISLDNTILDTSDYQYAKSLGCTDDAENNFLTYITNNSLPELPGAADFTCSIQASGGKVFIVSNRDAGSNSDQTAIINITQNNLSSKQICYDSILFANSSSDKNKNPRFNAIISGDYENVITTKKFPEMNIVAYVGNDIQDFPNLIQSSTKSLNESDTLYEDFGTKFFILPNPMSGSWRNNYWK